MIFAALQPYSERKGSEHSEASVIQRLRGSLAGIFGAVVVPFAPPSVQGLGEFGGCQFELLDKGGHCLEDLAEVTRQMVKQVISFSNLNGVFTGLSANYPQFLVPLDRDNANSPSVPL